MVGLQSFLRRLFAPNKTKRPDEVLPPPPEYRQVCSETVTDEKGQDAQAPTGFLNPNLQFTAREIESGLRAKDVRFAAAVVELMLPRLRLGVYLEPVGWGHYSYTLEKEKKAGCHSEACQCNKATGWDNIIGFKAWDYSGRFQQVADLVKHDLELRGFVVHKIEVYTHKCNLKNCRGGVFVKWEVEFPKNSKVSES